ADQAQAWIRDRAGAMVDVELAKRYGWKIGDRVILKGTIFPVNPELTIRAIYNMTPANKSFYFHAKYLEEAVSWYKGQTGFYFTRVAYPSDIAPTSRTIDDMFRNSPQPTKTESEKAFQLSFLAMLGNVKAFILSICAAVVFAILLVSANTMAMSIRERTREVAVLKTLGFARQTVLSLFVGEAVILALIGGIIGSFCAYSPLSLVGAVAGCLLLVLLAAIVKIFIRKVPLGVLALIGAIVGALLGFLAGKFGHGMPSGGLMDALKVAPSTMLVAWAAAA